MGERTIRAGPRLFFRNAEKDTVRRALMVSMQGRPDQAAGEADVSFRIVGKTEIGAAGVFGRVGHAAVRIDFQHERRAAAVHTKFAAPKAGTLERDEEAG